jgi:hypothetical protein
VTAMLPPAAAPCTGLKSRQGSVTLLAVNRGKGKASGCPSPLSSTAQSRAGSFAALPPLLSAGAAASSREGHQHSPAGSMEAVGSPRAPLLHGNDGPCAADVAVHLCQTTDHGHEDVS